MSIEKAANILREAQHSVVLSGAGISTPSGIPDFRSSNVGLWQQFNPMEVASLTAFRNTPEKFYAWFRPLAKLIEAAVPNPAHKALAQIEESGIVMEIITQNIDGLHQEAGSTVVHEVHGSSKTMTCEACNKNYDSGDFIQPYIENGHIPRCKECDRILKPDVVFFEELLPPRTWEAAERAINKCDVIIVVGTSLEVMPVAHLPTHAVGKGAKLIIVNDTPTYVDPKADAIFHQDVADILPKIANELTQ